MSYCPTCRAEFQIPAGVCPECDTRLVAALVDDTSDEEMLDVYACYDAQELERARELLADRGLEVLLRDRGSTAFPTTVGMTATKLVAVRATQHKVALEVLRSAIADGVLVPEGHLVEA